MKKLSPQRLITLPKVGDQTGKAGFEAYLSLMLGWGWELKPLALVTEQV